MDIIQIKYLLSIVDSGFNLTRSSAKLHISQPALSKAVKEVEFKVGSKIFVRHKGRITGLTRNGAILIENAEKVYIQYGKMMERINQISDRHYGIVRIGIAPVIISTVFNNALIEFIKQNPNIQLKIIEKGTFQLQNLLAMGKIDLAVIVSPATIKGIFEETIYEDDVYVWFNKKHEFASIDGKIPFSEIEKQKIVTLTDDFMVTFQLNKLFKHDKIQPNYFLQTQSWDLVLNLCQRQSDLVGILAAPIGNNYNISNLLRKAIKPRFPWKISLCYTRGISENSLVTFTKNWFHDYFSTHKHIN